MARQLRVNVVVISARLVAARPLVRVVVFVDFARLVVVAKYLKSCCCGYLYQACCGQTISKSCCGWTLPGLLMWPDILRVVVVVISTRLVAARPLVRVVVVELCQACCGQTIIMSCCGWTLPGLLLPNHQEFLLWSLP